MKTKLYNGMSMIMIILISILMIANSAYADSSTATSMDISFQVGGGGYSTLCSNSSSDSINCNVGQESSPLAAIASAGEGDVDIMFTKVCEAAIGGGTEYDYNISTYNIDWDTDSNDCAAAGHTWIANMGTNIGSTPNCCGDDGANDDWATYSGSLTTSTSLSCSRCLDGADQGSSTLFGNSYVSGTTCYHSNITCSSGSEANGTSCILDSNDICGDDVACQDCGNYERESTSACYTDCATNDDDDCITGYHCNASDSCVADTGTGSTCLEDSDCSSTYCRDDYDAGKFCADDATSCQHDAADFNNGEINESYICQSGIWSNAGLAIGGRSGGYFNGTIDEIAVFNRSLSSSEVMDHYLRGALDMNFFARSCNDSSCSAMGENWNKTCSSPLCDLRTSLSESRYFQFKSVFTTINPLYTPYLLSFNMTYGKELPDVAEFTGSETTDFANVTDLENVENMTLAVEETKVEWQNTVNASKQDYDAYINMDEGFVSINVSQLDTTINTTANITIKNIDCSDFELYYAQGFYNSRFGLLNSGSIVADETNLGGDCDDSSLCTSFSCSGTTLNFIAEHFDGFGAGVIKWINATDPSYTEQNVTIDTELQLGNYTIDKVWVGIVPEGGSETNYSMVNISESVYVKDNYTSNITGNYTYTVYVNDSESEITSKSSGFEMLPSNSPPPKVSLVSPENNTFGYDKRPTFNWSEAVDPNADNVTYILNITRTGCFGLSECLNPSVYVENITETDYTLEEDLDLDSPYNWTVTAFDRILNGESSETWNYTVMSLVDIELVISDISVAGLEPGDFVNTTDEIPPPFVIENKGNVFLNLTINATSKLWDYASLGTKYFMFKAGENSSKPGSFNMTLSAGDWLNISSVHQLAVANLDYNDTMDYAEIEIAVEVPGNEPPGAKSTNILIEATGTKI